MAHQTADIGAEIRYSSAIGTGIEWNGAYQEALSYFQKAQLLAKQNPDVGYPFLTEGREAHVRQSAGCRGMPDHAPDDFTAEPGGGRYSTRLVDGAA
jgi:hypothetical protein